MRISILIAASALLAACGGVADAGDEEHVQLDAMGQGWIAYATSGGVYWGTQTDANGSKCQASQASTANCRFLTAGGMVNAHYVVSVSNSFSSSDRGHILTLLGRIVHGEPAVTGLNQQTGYPLPGGGVQPTGFTVTPTVGSQGAVHFVPGTLTQDGTLAMRNFVRPSWQNCGSNLPETTPMPGTWRACTNSLVTIDLAAIDAVTTSSQYSRAVDQSLTHGILMAIGMGTESNVSSFRHAVLRVGAFVWDKRLTTSDLCMLDHFIDAQGDGLTFGNPGPLWSGTFVGC